MINKRAALAALAAVAVFAPAHAAVTISTAATQDIICSNDVCAPTASNAVLNVNDLANLLATGNVTVTTTGSGVQADDIDLKVRLSWSVSTNLALDAYESITIEKAVSISDPAGGLSLTTNDGGSNGTFSLGKNGNITFGNLSSALMINGIAYTLVGSLSSLASAIASNPSGAYALANSYNAAGDGTYTQSPIETSFMGKFDGLGHAIANLSVQNIASESSVGLFSANFGSISHFGLVKLKIVGSSSGNENIGAVAGSSAGTLFQDYTEGTISCRGSNVWVGGLVGESSGAIDKSHSKVRLSGTHVNSGFMGGLAGANEGTISGSYATGAIKLGKFGVGGGLIGENVGTAPGGSVSESFSTGSVVVGDSGAAGGMVGEYVGTGAFVEDSYATGALSGGSNSDVGGLIGEEARSSDEAVETSYSTGSVSGGPSSLVGGFIGVRTSNKARFSNDYWDLQTSGTSQATGKGPALGITGETTENLQSGLPAGFDPAIWNEKSNINGGLPYLLKNPPPK